MERNIILITGACGQIGSVLTEALGERYGKSAIIASDIAEPIDFDGLFEYLDATNYDSLEKIVVKYGVKEIYHLAAILSAKGEECPTSTWRTNMDSLVNVLEVSRRHRIRKVFFPSSIAVFGKGAPLHDTPQDVHLDPSTMYGVSKAAAENLINYYHKKYNLDVRSLRYPGIIGYQSLPGGGTTDYAVDIYHKAISGEEFVCFLKQNATLPMIFMDDAIRATIELMEAPRESLSIHTSYNLAGISYAPENVAKSIKKYYEDFKMIYKPDFRQQIAESWPRSIDDSSARRDWGWKHRYDLDDITRVMIEKLKEKNAAIV